MPLKIYHFAIILPAKWKSEKVSNVKTGPSWYITHIMLLPATTLFDSVVAGNRSYTTLLV